MLRGRVSVPPVDPVGVSVPLPDPPADGEPPTLSLKYGSPVVLVHNILDENNVNTIYFDKIIELKETGSIKKDVEVNTQMMINEFEELIKKYPEQWMWFHRRWKN